MCGCSLQRYGALKAIAVRFLFRIHVSSYIAGVVVASHMRDEEAGNGQQLAKEQTGTNLEP